MKKTLLFALGLFLFSSLTFAQETSIKDFDLKNYVAPDIKYRTLDLGTYFGISGNNQSADESVNSLGLNFNLRYYEYRNSAKVQSTSYGDIRGAYTAQWGKDEAVKQKSGNGNFAIAYNTQTRLYNSNKAFIGIHGKIDYAYSPYSDNDGEDKYTLQVHQFNFNPYISGGKGRIEPIESARQAMDILISLDKYNRLTKKPDSAKIDSLAIIANKIKFKRFYDIRYKRIYQLEELDKALQGMDLVDIADMVYFANLNDIWNYAPTYNRGSGFRFEGGLIPIYNWRHFDYEKWPDSVINKYKRNNYGAYGYFALNRNRPINYEWQSDIYLDLTFGYQSDNYIDIYSGGEEFERKEANNYWQGLLNFVWDFGYYPNTRTNVTISPYTAASYNDERGNKFGINTGFRFSSYYYLSPRARISANASIFYSENFTSDVPSPFWSKRFNTNNTYFDEKNFSYSFTFRFNYAIF